MGLGWDRWLAIRNEPVTRASRRGPPLPGERPEVDERRIVGILPLAVTRASDAPSPCATLQVLVAVDHRHVTLKGDDVRDARPLPRLHSPFLHLSSEIRQTVPDSSPHPRFF